MENKNIIFALASMLLLMTSCDHYDVDMHTTINDDGSCSREFKISVEKRDEQADTIEKRTLNFTDFTDQNTMKYGKNWKTTWALKGDMAQKAFPIKETALPKDTFMVTVKQEFSSIEKMTSDMPLLYDGKPYKAKGELTKSFKWFYTDYTYTETYPSCASYFTIPVTKYVEKDTASYWFSGEPNIFEGKSGAESCEQIKEMEMKVWQWIGANLISDACDILAKNYDLIDNPPMDKAEIISTRDTLISYALQHQFELSGSQDYLEDLFCKYFHSNAYGEAINSAKIGDKIGRVFAQKYEILSTCNLEYTLTLPGKIIDAGSGKLQDGVAHYKLSPEMFMVNDYTISATSRVTNLWAYLVSVLIILIAIFSFCIKRGKKI